MIRAIPTRQRVRRTLLLVSFLAFPIIMNYLSPYVIIDGAFQGIANGSLLVFGGLFVSALFVGRLWCGWACPAGGLQEAALLTNNRPVRGKWADRIKWLIWAPWIALIVFGVISAGGYRAVDPLLDTVGGISVAGSPDRPILFAYIIYYLVIALIFGLAVFVGRRAACHTICWMAPFMILGRALRNRFGWPALRLQAEPSRCSHCGTCTSNCPMSLDVQAMVKQDAMERRECILCATCIDGCPKGVIRYRFRAGK